MLRLRSGFDFPSDMDENCIPLCDAITALSGVRTTESCDGHGKEPFQLFLQVDTKIHPAVGLFFLTRCVDRRYWQYGNLWKLELYVGDMFIDKKLPIGYYLHSGNVKGEEAYRQAQSLVDNMNHHLNHMNFLKGYDLSPDMFQTEIIS